MIWYDADDHWISHESASQKSLVQAARCRPIRLPEVSAPAKWPAAAAVAMWEKGWRLEYMRKMNEHEENGWTWEKNQVWCKGDADFRAYQCYDDLLSFKPTP